jgi:ABC-type antimicrobial peptide transport system permease subunit
MDSSLPMYRAMTLTQALNQLRWNGRISQVLLDGIGAIALVLALVGLYAVTAFACGQRRKELAVRTALGARPRQIGAVMFRRVMLQIAAGIVVGLAGTFAFDRFFTESDAAVRLTDGVVIVPTIVAIALVGLVAALMPVYRAAHSEPITALRS